VDLMILGLGAIIGTGIFLFTGVAAAKYAGPGVVFSLLIAGLGASFIALCYAELASMIPSAGSAYTYAYTAFGEFIAWLVGWDLVLLYVVSPSAVAIGWSGYFSRLLKQLGFPLPDALIHSPGGAEGAIINLPASLISASVAVLLILGMRKSANVGIALVLIKLGVLLLFIILGFGHIDPANWQPLMPFGWKGVMAGAAITFFAYLGFDALSTAAEETKEPQRVLPIAIIAALLTSVLLYLSVAAILTGVIPQKIYPQLVNNPAPLAFVLEYIGEGRAAAILSLGALFGLTSVLLVLMMGQPRIFFSMAQDGLLPKIFARLHPRLGTPYLSTLFTGLAIALMAGFLPIGPLAELANIGALFAYSLVAAGAWFLRHTHREWHRTFRAPGLDFIAPGAIALCAYMMVSLPWETWRRFLVWLALGSLTYFFYAYRHSNLANK
jgi:APA family basic amino acid/polyamine antiporter